METEVTAGHASKYVATEVDGVKVRLATAREATRQELFEHYTNRKLKKCYWTAEWHPSAKYNGTHPNLGRWDWMVKTPCQLDVLPPEVAYLVFSPKDISGEYMLWMHFTAPVHHQTVRRILSGQGVRVEYVGSCTKYDVDKELLQPANVIIGSDRK